MITRQKRPETVTASDARQHFAELVNAVHRTRKPVIIEKSGIAVAALVSMDDLAELQQSSERRRRAFEPLETLSAKFAAIDPQDLDRESARAIRQVRAGRAGGTPRRPRSA